MCVCVCHMVVEGINANTDFRVRIRLAQKLKELKTKAYYSYGSWDSNESLGKKIIDQLARLRM